VPVVQSSLRVIQLALKLEVLILRQLLLSDHECS